MDRLICALRREGPALEAIADNLEGRGRFRGGAVSTIEVTWSAGFRVHSGFLRFGAGSTRFSGHSDALEGKVTAFEVG